MWLQCPPKNVMTMWHQALVTTCAQMALLTLGLVTKDVKNHRHTPLCILARLLSHLHPLHEPRPLRGCARVSPL